MDTATTVTGQVKLKDRLRLFYPVGYSLDKDRKAQVRCEVTEDMDQVFNRVESFRAKKMASVDSLLFKDVGEKSRRRSKEYVDDKEAKMLQEERQNYLKYLTASLSDYLPQEVIDQDVFNKKVHERARKTGRKKKQADGEGVEGNQDDEDDDNENIFFSDDEEEDDVSKY